MLLRPNEKESGQIRLRMSNLSTETNIQENKNGIRDRKKFKSIKRD